MVGTSAFCAGTSIGVAPIVAASGSVVVPPQPGSAATASAEAHSTAEQVSFMPELEARLAPRPRHAFTP